MSSEERFRDLAEHCRLVPLARVIHEWQGGRLTATEARRDVDLYLAMEVEIRDGARTVTEERFRTDGRKERRGLWLPLVEPIELPDGWLLVAVFSTVQRPDAQRDPRVVPCRVRADEWGGP